MSSPSVSIGPFVVGEKPNQLLYTFQDGNGNAINLTGYTVRFVVREKDGTAGAPANGALFNAPGGQVSYTWAGTEFPTPGSYRAEFWVGNGAQRYCSWLIEFNVRSPVGTVPQI